MTIRNLFNIILKIIGIIFIKEIILKLDQLLSVFYYETMYQNEALMNVILINAAVNCIIILFYLITARLLIFRSEMIINWMKMDKDFEEKELNLNIHRSVILSIAIIVIGGLMVAEGIPELIQRWYAYNENENRGLIDQSKFKVAIPAINILIGILMVNFHKQIVNLIEVKRKK